MHADAAAAEVAVSGGAAVPPAAPRLRQPEPPSGLSATLVTAAGLLMLVGVIALGLTCLAIRRHHAPRGDDGNDYDDDDADLGDGLQLMSKHTHFQSW